MWRLIKWWIGKSDEKKRLELEQERILITSQMMTVARQSLEIEKERIQVQLENSSILHTIHQLTLEAWLDVSIKLDALIPGVSNDLYNFDRKTVLKKTLEILLKRRDRIRIDIAKHGSTFSIEMELEDVENQINQTKKEIADLVEDENE